METKYKTFTLEEYALRNINYLENMVDQNNQPYFNIFWTDPISAVHDWPDICDVAVRQLQAAVMIRNMSGKGIRNEDKYRENFFKCFSYDDGLIYRPETPYTLHAANIDEQTLTLLTLITLMQDDRSNEINELIEKAVNTYLKIGVMKDNCFWFPDMNYFPIGWKSRTINKPGRSFHMGLARPLTQFYKLTGHKPAFFLAEKIINGILEFSDYVLPDGTFTGHVHGHLNFLAGLLDYDLLTGRGDLIERVVKSYEFIKSLSTRFGWILEETGRKSDCIGSETCAIMDFIQLSVLLSKNGYPQYWDDVERTVRNHLIESQFLDTDWMSNIDPPDDTDETTFKDLNHRMKGGFAGWSSPNHYLAYLEYLPEGWLQNISTNVLNKFRIAQNCCGGSGSRALFNVWRNIVDFKDGILSVNLHLDKKIKQAEVRCFKPYFGLTSLILKEDLKVKIRIPEFLDNKDISLFLNDERIDFKVIGNYLMTGVLPSNSKIDMKYPLPVKTETITIGNNGFQKYHYDITWKGDTVVKIKAHDNPISGFSHINKTLVRVFGRDDGPGNLYKRDFLLKENIVPTPDEIIEDKGLIYF